MHAKPQGLWFDEVDPSEAVWFLWPKNHTILSSFIFHASLQH